MVGIFSRLVAQAPESQHEVVVRDYSRKHQEVRQTVMVFGQRR